MKKEHLVDYETTTVLESEHPQNSTFSKVYSFYNNESQRADDERIIDMFKTPKERELQSKK